LHHKAILMPVCSTAVVRGSARASKSATIDVYVNVN
jgi:hypothetical protein